MGCAAWIRGLTIILLAAAGATAEEAPRWLLVTGPPELIPARPRRSLRIPHRMVVRDRPGGRRGGPPLRLSDHLFFRQGLAPGDPRPEDSRLRARQVIAAHLAIADIPSQRFHHSERLRRAAGGLAGASQIDLEVWLDDWRMDRAADGTIAARARDL